MTGLKHLRSRVKSIKSTQKITKAMQVVSAAKLRKVKEMAEDFNDYSNVLANIMQDVATHISYLDLDSNNIKFFQENTVKTYLFVIMSSERGLCGSFNSQIFRAVRRDIAELKAQNIQVRLLLIGKKAYDSFKNEYSDLIEEYYNITKDKSLPVVLQLKEKIISLINLGKIGKCFLYYNEFKNALTQIMTKTQVLPVPLATIQVNEVSSYEYEGSNFAEILVDLYITGIIKYGLLQSKASEEAARMSAMDNATRNAGELIKDLTLKLNRSRQAMITTELTEIISGAEAL